MTYDGFRKALDLEVKILSCGNKAPQPIKRKVESNLRKCSDSLRKDYGSKQACSEETTVSYVNVSSERVVGKGKVGKTSDSVILPQLLVPVTNQPKLNKTYSRTKHSSIATLLDQGSKRSFVLREKVKKLNLKLVGRERLAISTIDGESPGKEYDIAAIPIKRGNMEVIIKAIVVEALPEPKYSSGAVRKFAECQKNQSMARTSISEDGLVDVEMLIGVDFYWEVVDTTRKVVKDEDIYFLPTFFGFVLSGKVPD